MRDGHNGVGTSDFVCGEGNRLLASDDNGFVTNYWYDADGERTVKTSGEGEQIYVNSVFAGGRTNTAKFSLYVSPYLVANQGGRYTKHIYIGSQRIVSKLGDFDSYGSDPRRIPYAGSEADAVTVDYKGKYASQQQVIRDNYATFDVPYNGEDNNDYVDGEGFCCNDGSLEAAQARARMAAMAKANSVSGNFKENDDYEKLQFYYHPDHLGSSSYITNLDGEVAQHIEYVPFGEVFIEERNNTWNTPYLFNAKEFDEETGLYYYGARYYDPRLSLWMSVDPISNYDPRNSENYLDGEHNDGVYNFRNLNPYMYCYQSPITLLDPDGKQVYAVFNKASGKLAIIPDVSKINKRLPSKFVDALTFSKLTKADMGKYNYGILVKGVFTGGHSENGQIVHNGNSKEKEISAGMYNILENKGNTNPEHDLFFVLDPIDNCQYDKIDDRPGEINDQGEKRDGYNLHPGNVSWGCVTICKSNTLSPEEREQEWKIIHDAISRTKTEKVPDNRGFHKYYPGKQIKFGILKVKDK